MIPRSIRSKILKALKQYPSVLLVGPRQSGKTTLAKSLGDRYFDLEQETERLRLDLEWPNLISNYALLSPIILDEAQCFPEVFPRLRGAIDQRRSQNGRFILLGSVAPGIIKEVGESLAGRVAVIELSTFLIEELGNAELDSLWLYGGFPDGGVLNSQAFPDWQKKLYYALDSARSSSVGPPVETSNDRTAAQNVGGPYSAIMERQQSRQQFGNKLSNC